MAPNTFLIKLALWARGTPRWDISVVPEHGQRIVMMTGDVYTVEYDEELGALSHTDFEFIRQFNCRIVSMSSRRATDS